MLKEGFHLSSKKTKIMSGNDRKILGILVDDGMRISRKYIQDVRDEILMCKGETPVIQEYLMRSLEGKLRFVKRFDSKRGKALKEFYEEVLTK